MTIYKDIFEKEFCNYVVDYIKTNCVLTTSGKSYTNWWKWNIEDETFINILFEKIRKKADIDDYKLLWIHMTQYSESQWLRNHLDAGENKTMIILLTDEFTGGDTLLDSTKVKFDKGDGLFFDGYRTYHAVSEVKSGVRNALNIWFKPKLNKLI